VPELDFGWVKVLVLRVPVLRVPVLQVPVLRVLELSEEEWVLGLVQEKFHQLRQQRPNHQYHPNCLQDRQPGHPDSGS